MKKITLYGNEIPTPDEPYLRPRALVIWTMPRGNFVYDILEPLDLQEAVEMAEQIPKELFVERTGGILAHVRKELLPLYLSAGVQKSNGYSDNLEQDYIEKLTRTKDLLETMVETLSD